MKRLLAVALAVLFLSGYAMADFTEHPRYAHIDTLIKAFIQSISDKQAEYYALNGRYYQGIITPADPQDGITDADVNWAVSPVSGPQIDSWKEFAPNIFKPNVKIPFQMSINIYAGPEGSGWILTIDVWIDNLDPDQFGTYGSHWIYRHHEGPAQFNQDYLDTWYIGTESPI